MKKLVSFALIIVSVLAIALPALAAGNEFNVGWVSATAMGDLGGYVSCIYSIETASSAYVLQAFPNETPIQVKFDRPNLSWVSAKYGNVTGFIPVHQIRLTQTNLRYGLFTSYTLSEGKYGTAVSNLQRCLKNLGFYSGNIDGDFGPGTKSAVTAFQSSRGLDVDGIAGKDTYREIISRCRTLGILDVAVY